MRPRGFETGLGSCPRAEPLDGGLQLDADLEVPEQPRLELEDPVQSLRPLLENAARPDLELPRPVFDGVRILDPDGPVQVGRAVVFLGGGDPR